MNKILSMLVGLAAALLVGAFLVSALAPTASADTGRHRHHSQKATATPTRSKPTKTPTRTPPRKPTKTPTATRSKPTKTPTRTATERKPTKTPTRTATQVVTHTPTEPKSTHTPTEPKSSATPTVPESTPTRTNTPHDPTRTATVPGNTATPTQPGSTATPTSTPKSEVAGGVVIGLPNAGGGSGPMGGNTSMVIGWLFTLGAGGALAALAWAERRRRRQPGKPPAA